MAITAALVFLAALAGIIGLLRRQAALQHQAVTEMPDPVTAANVEQALRHISRTYGIEEHHDHHDEADGPAPKILPIAPKKRGRPRKPKPEPSPAPIPRQAKAPARTQSVLASGLRIPARIIYDGGHHAGIPRNIVILQAMGYHQPGGEFDVQCIRCICDKVKQFRAFRIDHVRELIDLETGEVTTDPAAWLEKKLATLV